MNGLLRRSMLVIVLGCFPCVVTADSLGLEQALEEGTRFNLDLLATRYNIPMAEADEMTAGLWNNPSLLIDTVFEPIGRKWDQTSAGGPRQFDFGLSYPSISAARLRQAVRVPTRPRKSPE